MNVIKKKCEICLVNENKYKCPKCFIVYCSLNCYKTHKETCSAATSSNYAEQNPETSMDQACSAIQTNDIVHENVKSNDIEFKDSNSDFVPTEKLKILGESDQIKQILSNKNLKELLVDLNSKGGKLDQEVERLMHEPLFREFSEACLKIVQNKTDLEPEIKMLN